VEPTVSPDNQGGGFRHVGLRDDFRCTACGASPLITPGVELHVDHVLPWPQGGETIDGNFQTKCKQCNLGKGNAFSA
jgi:hypothetical protein